jgi:hypothetical protein
MGLGDRWCDHDTLVSLGELGRSVLGARRARLAESAPWAKGVIVTYGEALAKADTLRTLASVHAGDHSHPMPVFLSTLSAAAIVFLVATHFAAHAAMLVRGFTGA